MTRRTVRELAYRAGMTVEAFSAWEREDDARMACEAHELGGAELLDVDDMPGPEWPAYVPSADGLTWDEPVALERAA